MNEFIDGTIRFSQGPIAPKGWVFDVMAHFSEGVGPALRIFDLHRLQRSCGGDLDIERLADGNVRMTRYIVAHGPESACRQSHDLKDALEKHLGIRTNVARGMR